jgi:hypothetical protein
MSERYLFDEPGLKALSNFTTYQGALRSLVCRRGSRPPHPGQRLMTTAKRRLSGRDGAKL